jgi:hypothetical protein
VKGVAKNAKYRLNGVILLNVYNVEVRVPKSAKEIDAMSERDLGQIQTAQYSHNSNNGFEEFLCKRAPERRLEDCKDQVSAATPDDVIHERSSPLARTSTPADAKRREQDLLAAAKVTKASDTEKNVEIYKELVSLNPEEKRYRSKLERYEAQKRREDADAQKEVAAFGEPPTQSDWDGSYRSVKDFLKRAANDPDSIKIDTCTRVYKAKGEGWLVGCDFRGKNAFGALVRQSKWFVIRHDRVVRVAEANAYSH